MPITFDDFKKCELRVGRVVSAEPVEGSEKLLRLMVDLGEKTPEGAEAPRQIVSGIAKSYAAENLVGQNIAVITNLEPRQIMGFESRGMLLAASNAEGLPIIIKPEQEVAPGTEIR